MRIHSLLFVLAVACGDKDTDTGDDGGTDGAGDDGGSGGIVALDDAPPQSFTAAVHGDGGGLLYELEFDDSATWSSSLSSGVLSVAAADDSNTRIQISLWETLEEGGSYTVEEIGEGGMPTGANVTFIDEGYGGQAAGGTLTITAWQETDSPQIRLLTGTLDAGPVTNPDDPTWVRDLRDGVLTAVRVASY